MARYELAYHTGLRRPCARGPEDVVKFLRFVSDVEWHEADGYGFASLPDTRNSYLILESIEQPDAVSEEYKRARHNCMSYSQEHIAAVDNWLEQMGIPRDDVMPHQKEFIITAKDLRGIINGSEQGTGKSLMCLLMAQAWNSRRLLVVCNKSGISEWYAEHDKWLGEGGPFSFTINRGLSNLSTDNRKRDIALKSISDNREMVVINYDALENFSVALTIYNPDMIVFDESHALKNPKAKVTKAAMMLCDHNPATRIILCSGTPIGNHVGDIYCQIRCISRNIMPITYNEFLTRFAKQVTIRAKHTSRSLIKYTGCQDPGNLMKIIGRYWYRATKAACLTLPDKIHRTVLIQLTPDQQRYYAAVKEDGEQALGRMLSLTGEGVAIIRLQQITSGFITRFETELTEYGEIETKSIVQIPCAKTEWLRTWTFDNLVEYPTSRAIIWCKFTPEIEKITSELGRILGFTRVKAVIGKTSTDDIDAIKESFNSRHPDGVQVIVAQIDKMYASHNLQSCDFNIYFSNSWSYIKRAQSEDRSHRMGRTEPVQYIDLVAEGTIDKFIVETLKNKKDVALRLAPNTVSGVDAISS